MNDTTKRALALLLALPLLMNLGCSSLQTPATADVAVSRAAVDTAAAAGAQELAPVEMNSAREKMARANKAMADEDYEQAMDLAAQAQADARLAQGKANSAKAQASADALADDLRVLRDELERSGK